MSCSLFTRLMSTCNRYAEKLTKFHSNTSWRIDNDNSLLAKNVLIYFFRMTWTFIVYSKIIIAICRNWTKKKIEEINEFIPDMEISRRHTWRCEYKKKKNILQEKESFTFALSINLFFTVGVSVCKKRPFLLILCWPLSHVLYTELISKHCGKQLDLVLIFPLANH